MTALAIFTSLTVQTRSSGALRPLFLSVPLRSTYVYLLPLSSSSLSFPLSSTVSPAVLLLLRHLSPPPRPPLSVLFRCPWRRDLSKAARGACKREEKKTVGRGNREAADEEVVAAVDGRLRAEEGLKRPRGEDRETPKAALTPRRFALRSRSESRSEQRCIFSGGNPRPLDNRTL